MDNLVINNNNKGGYIEVEKGLSKKDLNEAMKYKETLEFLSDRYDEAFSDFIIEEYADISDDEVGVVYVTECPLSVNKNGELERIKKSSSQMDTNIGIFEKTYAKEETKTVPKYYFSLTSSVKRGTTKDSSGRYTYTCTSKGVWDREGYSMIGGKNHPAKGDDFLVQSAPKTLSRTNSITMSVTYDNGLKPKEGTHYALEHADDFYLYYNIDDKPSISNRLKECKLTVKYKGKSSTGRQLYSYYVHSWKSMNISVSLDVATNKVVSLNITPSITSKYWKVASPVAFDF